MSKQKQKAKRSKRKYDLHSSHKFIIAFVIPVALFLLILIVYLTVDVTVDTFARETEQPNLLIATNETRMYIMEQTVTQSRITLDLTLTAEASGD